MEESKCTCGRLIGGLNHKISGKSKKVNKPRVEKDLIGYTPESIEALRDFAKSTRTLDTTAYRVLHLLVHVIFAFAPSAIAYAMKNNDPIRYSLEHVENDWDVLR